MTRTFFALLTAVLSLCTVMVVVGALGLDPWRGFRTLIFDQKVLRKVDIAEIKKQCLDHEVWHAVWLNGDGNKNTAALVAVAVVNLAHEIPTDLCTIFTQGLAMLPTAGKRTPETERSFIIRSVEVVSGQSSTAARRVQYDAASEVSDRIVAAYAKTGSTDSALPQELAAYRCVRKFLRSRWGVGIIATAGFRAQVQKALVAEYGTPVYTAPDGTEFFGRCT